MIALVFLTAYLGLYLLVDRLIALAVRLRAASPRPSGPQTLVVPGVADASGD